MAEFSYNEVTPELVEEFKKIVPGKVFVGDEINDDYAHDEMPIYGKGAPSVLIEATTTEDISAIMKLCYENSIPVIPRGAGTGLTGAAVALHGGVMIDMSKIRFWNMTKKTSLYMYRQAFCLTSWLRMHRSRDFYIRQIRVKNLQLSAEMYLPMQVA